MHTLKLFLDFPLSLSFYLLFLFRFVVWFDVAANVSLSSKKKVTNGWQCEKRKKNILKEMNANKKWSKSVFASIVSIYYNTL